ncbi:DUF3667 domain-containing protein [Pedobacter sp. L105]|uniref:DUF3667 domain-containing protein n=1 Tax=Pedobacter sp. L105 TaxID=1641871 RepID=UPI00131A71D2|nr:DUF3667 domain-containing protein [Pedobacter sp. L105]
MSGHYRKEKNCLNCGHEVEHHYCSRCGQPNLELKENFWAFIGHSVGHYFHFDAKFWQTLIPLLTKPGQVTLDYLAGKRARYIHPISLYIFVSIIYFLIVPRSLVNEDKVKQDEIAEAKKEALDSIGIVHYNINSVPSVRDINKQVAKKVSPLTDFRKLSIHAKEHYLDSLKKLNAVKPSEELDDRIKEYNKILVFNLDSTYESYQARQKTLPADQQDGWMVRYLKKKSYSLNLNQNEKSGDKTSKEQIDEEVKHYEPKQFFILMPLLALFIMINFRRNRIYYIDHLVFTIHGMTAYFIVSIITKPIEKYIFGLDSFMSDLIDFIVFAGIVWYLYKGLKLFYNRSRNVTIRKTIMVMIFYSLAFFISQWMLTEIITYMMSLS